MSRVDTSLDDIAEAISDLAISMGERFEQVNARFDTMDVHQDKGDERLDRMDSRFDAIDQQLSAILIEQKRMRDWLERLDYALGGINSDIAEVYDRILVLEKQAPLTARAQKELQDNLGQLFTWAKLVSRKTGVKLPKV